MENIVSVALDFAAHCHRNQVRKYSGLPYIVHPIAVMGIVGTVTDDENMLAAALLHDVVEDCGVTYVQLLDRFNEDVTNLVHGLTHASKKSDGNRAVRKHIDLLFLAEQSDRVQTIKLADLIHNSSSIVEEDPNFAVIYMKEKRALLEVLNRGDATLYDQAKAIVDGYYESKKSK